MSRALTMASRLKAIRVLRRQQIRRPQRVTNTRKAADSLCAGEADVELWVRLTGE
jgi:hypothetical protein